MKPKQSNKADYTTVQAIDCLETPPEGIRPLLPYLAGYRIWEPAAGSGRLCAYMRDAGLAVGRSDLQHGVNFFDVPLEQIIAQFAAIVTNPPYSIKVEWMQHCYRIGLPFALLLPLETIGLGRVQAMMQQYGGELLLLDRRVNFILPSGKDSSAQFPVYWHCWKLLSAPICYGKVE